MSLIERIVAPSWPVWKKAGGRSRKQRQQEEELQSMLNQWTQSRNVIVDWCLPSGPPFTEEEV
jgi:hypothetical protein